MEEKTKKRIHFATILNIIFAVTSLFYVILSIVYFIAMGYALFFGNEYDILGFIFGLVGLPTALAVLVVPVMRIIILTCNLKLNKNIKTGGKTSGLIVATGVMQIIDAVASAIIFIIIGSFIFLFSSDPLQSVLGNGRMFDLVYGLFGLTIDIPVIIKGVLQIISAVFLFKSKEKK